MNNQFNAHHSPVGAFATFTLGLPGPHGGFGLELGAPACQSVYLGVEDESGAFHALPFFEHVDQSVALEDFVRMDQGDEIKWAPLHAIDPKDLERDYQLCSDKWSTPLLNFTLYSPAWPLPEPGHREDALLPLMLIPAVFAELTIDNRNSQREKRAFFGYKPDNRHDHMHEVQALREEGIAALANGSAYGLATTYPNAETAMAFAIEEILGEPNRDRSHFNNGTLGVIECRIPPGELVTIPFVLGFYRGGTVTTGLGGRYFYTRFYDNLEQVFRRGLRGFSQYTSAALEMDKLLEESSLSPEQRFHIAHSVHSYYGSTQLLDVQSHPFWVVNEGEYRMMNTLDLTADHVFYEMRMHPWTTRNVLENFLRHYSYYDEVRLTGSSETFPGGISFCHDMGVMNNFTPRGQSCYEVPGKKGCFSYMTHEELVNWIACASVYYAHSSDQAWIQEHAPVFNDCLTSLLNRDNPVAAERSGIMGADSTRCEEGSEITTYDSLDTSLGQARANTYLAVKTWAAYLGLERILEALDYERGAATCREQAQRIAESMVNAVRTDGTIPAVLEGDSPSVIIPIVEGLAFAWYSGRDDVFLADSPYDDFLNALQVHVEAVLLSPGAPCLFGNGAWKLSSTSINSWLSKIYLNQHVIRFLLGVEGEAITERADKAHLEWLTREENRFWAWSDQCYEGIARGSRYYPRGVTSILWLNEAEED